MIGSRRKFSLKPAISPHSEKGRFSENRCNFRVFPTSGLELQYLADKDIWSVSRLRTDRSPYVKH
jgi:hypothetical protein